MGTVSVKANTIDPAPSTSMAGMSTRLRPTRSLRLPATSMVGTTVAVYVANSSVSVPFDRLNSPAYSGRSGVMMLVPMVNTSRATSARYEPLVNRASSRWAHRCPTPSR